MGSLFSTPKVPQPQQIREELAPPPVKKEDKAVQEASAEAARRRSKARGFRSTLLSKSMPDGVPALQTTLGS
jgi:hypothetical protein